MEFRAKLENEVFKTLKSKIKWTQYSNSCLRMNVLFSTFSATHFANLCTCWAHLNTSMLQICSYSSIVYRRIKLPESIWKLLEKLTLSLYKVWKVSLDSIFYYSVMDIVSDTMWWNSPIRQQPSNALIYCTCFHCGMGNYWRACCAVMYFPWTVYWFDAHYFRNVCSILAILYKVAAYFDVTKYI